MYNNNKNQKDDRLTILLIPNSGAKAKRLSFSQKQIKGAIMAVGLMAILLFLAIVNIYHSRDTISEANRIKGQYQEQTRQVKELNEKLLEMEKQRERIEEQQEQIRKLVGSPSATISTRTSSRGDMGGGIRSARYGKLPEITIEAASLQFLMDEQERETQQLLDLALGKAELIKSIPNRWPVEGRITSAFGWRSSPFDRSKRKREFHDGIDIAAPRGTAVRAAADGVVIYAGWVSGWGRLIKIRHKGGIVTSYAHNASLLVKKGDTVAKGSVIAKVGSSGRSTGPHLHFAIEKNGKLVDPMIYLP